MDNHGVRMPAHVDSPKAAKISRWKRSSPPRAPRTRRRWPRSARSSSPSAARATALEVERDHLRLADQELQHELALIRRRLFAAKAERLDTAQLELELGHKLAALDAMDRELRLVPSPDPGDEPAKPKVGGTRKPTGRRDLREADLPEERIELTDPELEGRAERIRWLMCFTMWNRS